MDVLNMLGCTRLRVVAWHDLDETKLNMTAVLGFLDATRDGRFDQLRASLTP
jgi:hypothetical protein